jgi:hypothetical protein
MVAPSGVQAIAVATTNLDKATLAGHLPHQSALSPLTIVCAPPPQGGWPSRAYTFMRSPHNRLQRSPATCDPWSYGLRGVLL